MDEIWRMIHVRPAEEAEAGALAALHALCWPRPWPAADFAAAARAPDRLLLVAGDPPGGFGLFQLAGDEAELLMLAVDPALRRGGLGRALVEAGLQGAAQRGADRVLLEVGVTNGSAGALYEAAGFRDAGLRRGYYPGPPPEDARVMALTLPRVDK